MMQRIESGGMMVTRRDQPQNSQPFQHIGYRGLHPHEHKMLMMGLSHVNHILDRQRGGPIDRRHRRQIQYDNRKTVPPRHTL